MISKEQEEKKVENQGLNKMKKIADLLQQTKQLEAVNLEAGKGGFGDVMIVKDMQQKEYAIKIIPIFDIVGSICDDKLNLAKNEAQILKNCSHPNIVKYEDSFEIGLNYFILMEKCEMSLEDFIDKKMNKDMGSAQFISFALQILEAMQYFHSKNYVFRDISLRNILLDSHQIIKLCDFGLSKQIDPLMVSKQQAKSQIKGVFFFFPPEILEIASKNDNQKVYQNKEGDIWAFGICLYILAGATYQHVYQFTMGSESYQMQKYIDPQINYIILGILQRDPKQRPSVPQIIETFSKFKDQQFEINSTQSNQIYNKKEDLIFCQAKILFQLGNYNQVINLLEQIIKDNPKNDEFLAWIGRSYCANNQLEKSQYWIQLCFELNKNNHLAHFVSGNVFDSKKMYNEAIKSYKQAIQINPTDVDYHYNLAITYKNNKTYNEAITSYKQAIQINPTNTSYHYNLAFTYDDNKMYNEAITSYKQAIQINPTNAHFHNNLAIAYKNNKMYNEAITSYKQAIQINPTNGDYHYNLANTYDNNKMYNEAITSYKQAIQINPTDADYHNNLANTYKNNKMYNEAITSYKQAIQINPTNIKYINTLNELMQN